MIIVGSIFGLVGLILGTVFVLIGSKDYSSYTGRAYATVFDVHVTKSSSGQSRTTRDYDVRFTAEGRTVEIFDIGGVHSGDFDIGDVQAVAFPPGDPELAVWAETVEGGQQVLLYVGLGVGLLFAGLGALIAILGLRRRSASAAPVDAGVGVPGALVAEPGTAQDIGRPWTFAEVVSDLVRRTAETPYTVDSSGNSVTVRVNLADTSWWALLQRQGLTKSYSTTLTPVGPAKAARSDAAEEFEWAAGPNGQLMPVATGRMSTSGGRVWAMGSEQIWALGPDGYQKVVDYRLDSGELQSLIALTLKRAGWSTAFDTQSRIGLWVAGIAIVGAAAAVVFVLVG
jgi:hypothetical protein